MARELVLGAVMFLLLLVVAASIVLIVWDPPERSGPDANASEQPDP